MKKIITILILSITFALQSFAQQDSINTVNKITETERIIDKYGGQAVQKFNELITKVTPMAEQGFDVVVKLQIAKGIGYLFITIITIIFWFIFFKNYKLALQNQKESGKNDWVDCNRGTPALISLALAVCGTVATPFSLYESILHLAAPEWYAIKEILKLF